MRILFRLILVLITLVLLLVVALVFVPADRIARLAETRFEAATGRALRIDGDVRATIYPRLGVKTGAVTLANADWAGDQPMIRAEGLVIGVNAMGLISGDIRVEDLRVISPEIRLQTNAEGRGNWEFEPAPATGSAENAASASTEADADAGATAATQTSSGIPAFSIDNARLSDGRFTFLDGVSGAEYQVSDVNGAVSLPEFAGTAEVDISGRMNGQEIDAKASLDGLAGFLDGQVRPANLELRVGGTQVTFDGEGGLTPAAEGRLVGNFNDLAAVFALIGQAPPELPGGMGKRIGVDTTFVFSSEGSLHLRDARITVDDNTLVGAVDLFLDDKPKLRASFDADLVDLSALAGDTGAAAATGNTAGTNTGEAGAATSGWPTDPIDVSALAAIDAEVAFRAKGLKYGDISLGRIDTLVRLNRSRMVFDLNEVSAYSGNITGEFVVNGRGGLSVGGDLNIADVALQPLLQATADYDRLIGSVNMSTKFLAIGNSVDALMNSLSGSGDFAIGKGELLGLDLVGMLRNLDASYRGEGQKTIFDGISASYTIADGVLSNDDLLFAAPLAKAEGAGKVGIGAQTLDYRVTPTALGGGDGLTGISVPVLITGTWANPKFRPDLEALFDADLQKLEDEVKQQINQQSDQLEQDVKENIADNLGLQPEDANNLEEAVKDKIEDEIKDGLLNLLGNN